MHTYFKKFLYILLSASIILSSLGFFAACDINSTDMPHVTTSERENSEENGSETQRSPENTDQVSTDTPDINIDVDVDGRPGSGDDDEDRAEGESNNSADTLPNDNTETQPSENPGGNDQIESLIFIIEGTVVKGLTDYGKTLYHLEVPEGVTEIGASAFKDCDNIRKIDLPDTLVTIGDSAFEDCDSLAIMVIPDSVTTIGAKAFSCDGIISLTLGSGITTFYSDRETKSFIVGTRTLEFCNRSSIPNHEYSLHTPSGASTHLVFSETGESNILVDENGFIFYEIELIYDQSKVFALVGYEGNEQVITLPDSYNGKSYTVYSNAFSIPGITDVTVPESVLVIDDNAFNNCADLVNVTLPDTAIEIGWDAFIDTPIYDNSDNWENGILYIGKHLIATRSADLPTEVTVKPGTLTIAQRAFSSKKSLTKVTLPEGLLRISEKAFWYCSALAEVVFPEGIQYIERDILDNTEYEKTNLSFCTDGFPGLYVGNYMIRIGNASGRFYCIREGTTFIAANALNINDTLIYMIQVPASVKTLEKGSLYTSDRLETVYYFGTVEEWNAIDNRGCFDGFGSVDGDSITIICTNGEIIYTPET